MPENKDITLSSEVTVAVPMQRAMVSMDTQDWANLKSDIDKLRETTYWPSRIGSLLIGFALATLLQAYLTQEDHERTMCVVVGSASLFSGICLWTAEYILRKDRFRPVDYIKIDMIRIEERMKSVTAKDISERVS